MLVAVALPALAQDTTKQPSAAQLAQQQKMKDCNAQAKTKGLTGDPRQKFMSECLSAAGVPVSQQEKMKTCNAEAKTKGLAGDERKAFMSSCLSSAK
ncbi:MAG TPA: PsiF family protein [Candidatus Angelobacter sp.]|nr:PsiF family protein [Candidatus Angelobacter sp.]